MNRLISIPVILLLLVTGLSPARSQSTFTLSELEKLCAYSSSGFETQVLKRGYSFQSAFSDDDTKLYWYDSKRPNGRQDQISRTKTDLTLPIIAFATTSKQYYLSLKDSLGKNNYKFFKEVQQKISEDLTTAWYYYSNNIFTAIIYTYTTPDGLATYTIQVYKNI